MAHFDVICDLLLDRRTATWNLFVKITKQITTGFFSSKSFIFIVLESRPFPTLANTKKVIWRNLLSQYTKWSNLVGCYALQWIVIGPGKSLHYQPWLKWLLVEWKLTAKAELNCKIYKSWRKCWKNRGSFCHWKAWMLPWIPQEFKEYDKKNLQLRSSLKATRFEFWMKEALVTVKICVLCGWWFSNQFDIVSETPHSCDTVGWEL